MPKELGKDARAEWRRLVAYLKQRGNLCPTDAMILQVTCQVYSDLMRALRYMNRPGDTSVGDGSPLPKYRAGMIADLLCTYRRCLKECTVPPPDHLRLRALPRSQQRLTEKQVPGGDR